MVCNEISPANTQLPQVQSSQEPWLLVKRRATYSKPCIDNLRDTEGHKN